MMIEKIAKEGDEKLLIALDDLRLSIEKLYNGVINYCLPLFVEECRNASLISELCNNYVQQYVMFQMDTYINLTQNEKNDLMFEVIVKSVLKLHNSQLYRLLFEDTRWLQEWLYTEKNIDNPHFDEKNNLLQSNFQSLKEAIYNAHDKICIYDELQNLRNKYIDIQNFNNKLYPIIENLVMKLSVSEYKILYLRGEKKFLYYTKDVEYIESELNKTDEIQTEGIDLLISLASKDCKCLFFNFVLPRLKDDYDKIGIIKEQIYDKSVQDILFSNEYYSNFMGQILEQCLQMKDEDLSDTYFEYIKTHRMPLNLPLPIRKQNTVLADFLSKIEKGYLYTLDNISKKDLNPVIEDHKRNGEDVELFAGYIFVFNIICCKSGTDIEAPTIEDLFGDSLIYYYIENEKLNVCLYKTEKTKTRAFFSGRILSVVINGSLYEIHLKSRKTPKFIISQQPFNGEFQRNSPENIFIMPDKEELQKSNFFYYRPNEIIVKYGKKLNHFSHDIKLILGIEK